MKPVADNPFFPPDDLQQELTTTRHLLGELEIGSSNENEKVLDLLRELKEVIQKKDLELQRYFRKYFQKKIAPPSGRDGSLAVALFGEGAALVFAEAKCASQAGRQEWAKSL